MLTKKFILFSPPVFLYSWLNAQTFLVAIALESSNHLYWACAFSYTLQTFPFTFPVTTDFLCVT